MSNYRVLITGIGGNIGQGILKSLRATGRPFEITGVDMEPLSAGFFLADHYERVSRSTDPAFRNELAGLVGRHGIGAIYASSPSELEFFGANRHELERELGVTIFVNPLDVIRTGSDKLLTAQFLERHGLPYIPTALGTDARALGKLIRDFGFPLIVKPRRGFSSHNVFLVHSRREVESACKLVPDMVVQRYVADPFWEYTSGTVSGGDGKVRAVITLHRRLIQGTTYQTELVQDEAMEREVVRVVEALGATCVCNLQFRMLDGRMYIFEINPRFSGTCGIRYLYGFNDPEMAFDLLHLKREVSQPEIRPSVVLRYWNEVLVPGASFADLQAGGPKREGVSIQLPNPAAARPPRLEAYSEP